MTVSLDPKHITMFDIANLFRMYHSYDGEHKEVPKLPLATCHHQVCVKLRYFKMFNEVLSKEEGNFHTHSRNSRKSQISQFNLKCLSQHDFSQPLQHIF